MSTINPELHFLQAASCFFMISTHLRCFLMFAVKEPITAAADGMFIFFIFHSRKHAYSNI